MKVTIISFVLIFGLFVECEDSSSKETRHISYTNKADQVPPCSCGDNLPGKPCKCKNKPTKPEWECKEPCQCKSINASNSTLIGHL